MPVRGVVQQIARQNTGQVLLPFGAAARDDHELRRPEVDFLRNGIYELRVSLRGVHHRILYFFRGSVAAVVSHGLVKSGWSHRRRSIAPESARSGLKRIR